MSANTAWDHAWEPATLTGLPVLQVHPTLRCHLSCTHCYASSGPDARQELSLADLLRVVDDGADLGYAQLSVSGGEPLLYDGLADLLERGRRRGMVTSLVTNGLLLRTRRWDRVRHLVDILAVSVDGDEQEHDLIRGRRGAFARTVAGLRVLQATGTPYAVVTTLTQFNAAGLEPVVRLAARHGASAVQVHPLSSMGRAAEAMVGHRPDGIELLASLAEAQWLGQTLGVPVLHDAVTRDQLRLHPDAFVPGRGAPLCRSASTLVLAADGSVRPLTWDVDASLHLGSVLDASLRDLAADWRLTEAPSRLRAACQDAWVDLLTQEAPAVYWYDAVADASHRHSGISLGAVSF